MQPIHRLTWKNAGQIQYLGLLILGVAVALWTEKASTSATQRGSALHSSVDRMRQDFQTVDHALRAQLLDLRVDNEPRRIEETTQNLSNNLAIVQKKYGPGDPILNNLLEKLRAYTFGSHAEFQTRIQDQQKISPPDAAETYRQQFPAQRKQRDDLINQLLKHTYDYWQKQIDQASRTLIAGGVGIVLLVVAMYFVSRWQARAVSQPLNQLVDALDHMRHGDFTHRLDLTRPEFRVPRTEFRVLADGLNRLADDLSLLVGQVQRSGIQVNMTATEIAATAREQQSTTNEIAATTAEIGATSKQISATSKELDKTMNEVGQVAEDTTQLANRGQTGIARMESTMRQIMEAGSGITGKLAVLNEKTANINSVVTTITKVADQTNLLSLNAAIEAEKAGEYGLGFAVVALEIRRLADQTAVATYDIEKMVKEMQTAVAAGVMGMDKFSEEIRRGADEIRQVSAQLAQIIHQVQTLTPRFATVSEGMHAQATGAQQISETLTQLSEAAHQSADSLRQSNLAIDQLNEAARGLQTSVTRFKLDDK